MLVIGIGYHVAFMVGLRSEREALKADGLIHAESHYPASLTLIVAIVLLLIGIARDLQYDLWRRAVRLREANAGCFSADLVNVRWNDVYLRQEQRCRRDPNRKTATSPKSAALLADVAKATR